MRLDFSDIDPTAVIIFTDGSCYPNPKGEGGWCFYCKYKNNTALRFGYIPEATNNVAELEAIKHALDYIPSGSRFDYPILIYTDSKYCKNSLTEWGYGWRSSGWKTSNGKDVANRQLIETCLTLIDKHSKYRDVSIRWVKGHAGIPENELVDQNASYARINKESNWFPDFDSKILTTKKSWD